MLPFDEEDREYFKTKFLPHLSPEKQDEILALLEHLDEDDSMMTTVLRIVASISKEDAP